MPNYDYVCDHCKSKTEVFHKIEEESPLKSCPECNKTDTLKKSVTYLRIGTTTRSMQKRTGPRAGEGGLPRHWDEYDVKAKSSVREFVHETEWDTANHGREKMVKQLPQFGHDDSKSVSGMQTAKLVKPPREKKIRTGKILE